LDTGFDEKIDRTAIEAARRKFTPEFMNRIDKTVVFRTLRPEHLEKILEIELGMVLWCSSASRWRRDPGSSVLIARKA
jgi:ATP-dependent Clp protease ATP-binding subunit ClpB